MRGVFKNLRFHLMHEDLGLTASALAFTTCLSLVPFLAVMLAALNYVDGLEGLAPKVESFVLENFTGTAGAQGIELLQKGIKRIQSGRLGSIGALILILTSTRMMFELEMAFHRIWHLKNRRPLVKRLFFYWLFLLLFPFVLALWVSLFTGHGYGQEWALWLPFKAGFVVTFLILFIFQKWLPSTTVHLVPALLGTFLSTVGLWLLERSYKMLSAQVFSYGKVYGSLAAIPASLLWIFLVWIVILWGVALTASLQKGASS